MILTSSEICHRHSTDTFICLSIKFGLDNISKILNTDVALLKHILLQYIRTGVIAVPLVQSLRKRS